MRLDQYINAFEPRERMKARMLIAEKLGISEIYLRSMINGNRRIPEKWAVSIEIATNGLVRRQDVCPHLYNN